MHTTFPQYRMKDWKLSLTASVSLPTFQWQKATLLESSPELLPAFGNCGD